MSPEIGWRSQPFAAEGGTAADGIRKQLGRPDLDLLTVLVREAAQNSWDARRAGEQVRFRLDLCTVGPAHATTWRDQLARGIHTASGLPLSGTLKKGLIRLLVVSDRGTTGLGGPTRADQHAPENRDFISFVRNVGEPRDKGLGGGTYGFGKSIFYLVAQSAAVLVHTRCIVDGRPQSRLIGCALWESYEQRGHDGGMRPFTGRHWWGELTTEIVEPLIGEVAEAAARALGLPAFAPDETGTDVVVIDPDLDGRTAAETAGYLAETMAWQLWPKMIAVDGRQATMTFSVACDGVPVPVPDPETTSPLSMFVSAHRKMLGDAGQTLACLRPAQNLGRLGLHRGHTGHLIATSASTMAGIEDSVHHVALMRAAELVVRYHPGPRMMSKSVGYAGVFKADRELDDVYAAAEPPTHDNWVANQLENRERTFVRTTFTRINERLEKFVEPGYTDNSSSAATPLGAVSSMFSSLVGGTWGDGGATDYGTVAPSTPPPAAPGTPFTPANPTPTGAAPTLGEEPYSRAGYPNDPSHSSADPSTWDHGADPAHQDPGRPDRPGADAPSLPAARNPKIRFEGDPIWERRDGQGVVIQQFTLPAQGWQRVHPRLAVALSETGTSRETDPPAGAARPTLIGWESSDGAFVAEQTLETCGGDGRRWRAVVRPAPDTLTEVDLRVTPWEQVTR